MHFITILEVTADGSIVSTKSPFVAETCNTIETLQLTETGFGSKSCNVSHRSHSNGVRYVFENVPNSRSELTGYGISSDNQLTKVVFNLEKIFSNFSCKSLLYSFKKSSCSNVGSKKYHG